MSPSIKSTINMGSTINHYWNILKVCLKVVITQSDNYNEGNCVGEFEGLDVSTPTLGSSSGELEAYGER